MSLVSYSLQKAVKPSGEIQQSVLCFLKLYLFFALVALECPVFLELPFHHSGRFFVGTWLSNSLEKIPKNVNLSLWCTAEKVKKLN